MKQLSYFIVFVFLLFSGSTLTSNAYYTAEQIENQQAFEKNPKKFIEKLIVENGIDRERILKWKNDFGSNFKSFRSFVEMRILVQHGKLFFNNSLPYTPCIGKYKGEHYLVLKSGFMRYHFTDTDLLEGVPAFQGESSQCARVINDGRRIGIYHQGDFNFFFSKVDEKTFRGLGKGGIYVDKDKAYFLHGKDLAELKNRDIHPMSFGPFSEILWSYYYPHLYADKNNIYFREGGEFTTLKEIDRQTFILYEKFSMKEGSELKTYELYKDKNHFYLLDILSGKLSLQENLDVSSELKFGQYGLNGELLFSSDLDFKSFLGIFSNGNILYTLQGGQFEAYSGVDLDTLSAIYFDQRLDSVAIYYTPVYSFLYKDKDSLYVKTRSNQFLKVTRADPDTFRVYDNTVDFIIFRDKNQVYFGREDIFEVIQGADSDTFKNHIKYNKDSRNSKEFQDKNYIWYFEDNKWKVRR